MAYTAFLFGREVIVGFANRVDVVMTGRTRLCYRCVIHASRRCEVAGHVATIALFVGWNMANGFSTGYRTVVASVALARRAFEDAINVA